MSHNGAHVLDHARFASLRRVVRPVYDRLVRPVTPRRPAVWNGVAVPGARLLDATTHRPEFKRGLISSIEAAVAPRDTVVDIGGGFGVAAVTAARAGGEVTTYEAAAEQCRLLEQTVAMNRVSDRVGIVHGVVGDAGERVYGSDIGRSVAVSDAVDGADVLTMDVEGAEVDILWRLIQRVDDPPATLIMETHPPYGAPTAKMHSLIGQYSDFEIVRDVDAGQTSMDGRAITATLPPTGQ